MADAVVYHRTLSANLAKLPYAHFEARRKVFETAGARTAYEFTGHSLEPIIFVPKKDQDFAKYATPWERAYSRLVNSSFRADPVVDRTMLVVGHYGWFAGNLVLVSPSSGGPLGQRLEAGAKIIGDVFPPNSIDKIVSNRLPPNTLDWTQVLPGAHKVLKSGGSIEIAFQGVGNDAAIILDQMRRLGFNQIEDVVGKGAVLKAIK